MNKLEKVLARLKNVERQGKDIFKSVCPCHEDDKASLSISLGKNGRVLLFCHAGCKTEHVLYSIKLTWADLFNDVIGTGYTVIDNKKTFAYPDKYYPNNSELRNEVYSSFIKELNLKVHHRSWLKSKGLVGDYDKHGYRSLTLLDSISSIGKLRKTFSSKEILSVPGFVEHKKDVIYPALTSGILIPFKAVAEKRELIVGFQVRQDVGAKYVWFSTPEVSVGSPIHISPIHRNGSSVNITEGPIKAEILADQYVDEPALGVPGVNNWKYVIPYVKENKTSTVSLYYDTDRHVKESVKRAMNSLIKELQNSGVENIRIADWDRKYKGIDDYLLNCKAGEEIVYECC